MLHARQPLPPEATPILDDALARVSRSPLYDAARTHDVFLCDTPALYSFFSLWNHRSGGISHTWAWGNAFIRPADVRRGRVIGALGVREGRGAHARVLRRPRGDARDDGRSGGRVGRWDFKRLAAFQKEGYADYVAFARSVDLPLGRAAETCDMNVSCSGHYDRYRLLVGYLLQRAGLSVDDLLAHPLDRAATEAQLLAADGL